MGLWFSLCRYAAHAGYGRGLRSTDPPGIRTILPHGAHAAVAPSAKPKYRVTVGDHCWYWLYLPIARCAETLARLIGTIQQGRISVYLTYSFCTLLALLFFVR